MCRTVFCIFSLPLMCSLQADDFPAVYNSEPDRTAEPMAADEAAATMKLPEGFRCNVFVSEPEVQNPIAMAWDDHGRMWVAENYTYAERAQRFDLSLRDRVLVLEDTNRDGVADSRKVFTDNVQMLTSVEVGRGGVWLMCPPQLLFIPDANADGVPDGPAQVCLDGFTVAQDNYHNFANGLRWGPDGWLYGRCGHSCPGKLGVPGTADERRVPIDGGIWRFHPERETVEVLCHGTVNPWGHDWDQHGELFFINTVIGHLWHMMPGAHFRESFGHSMNPHVYERLDMIADHYHFDTNGSWTQSRDGKANDFGGGHAHIGMMISHNPQWPPRYHHKLFTLNMHGRRANVERLERVGAGYTGRHEPDFLIATDPFFRGMDLSHGPDGSVYVIDWSDTGECHDSTGVHRTSGRIFRISYRNSSQWTVPAKPSCMNGDSTLAELWKNYQAGTVTTDKLRLLLRHEDEHVRVWAIRLLTDFWPLDTIVGPKADAQYPDDSVSKAALNRVAREDTSGLVLLTLASTLQRLPVRDRVELAAALFQHQQYRNDRDLPSMVWFGLIAVGQTNPESLATLAQQCQWPTTLRWMARNVAARVDSHPGALEMLLKNLAAAEPDLKDSVLLGLRDAFQGWQKVKAPSSWVAFTSDSISERHGATVRELNLLFGDGRAMEEVRSIALNSRADINQRLQALKTFIAARPADLQSVCESLLNERGLNVVAAQGLAAFDTADVAQKLVENYRRFHPDDRPAVIELLVSRPSFAAALLDRIGSERGMIPATDLTPFHVRQIHSLGRDRLNARVTEVWGELRETPTDRLQQMEELRQQLTSTLLQQADLSAGRALFRKTCAQCHTLYGEGRKIGPDLTGSQRSNLDYLLQNIVDPSAVVGATYRMTIVVMKDGRVLSGLVLSQDDRILQLQTQSEQITLAVAEIEEMQPTNLSAMPDGLLKYLTPQQTSNLIAYLMHPVQVELPAGE